MMPVLHQAFNRISLDNVLYHFPCLLVSGRKIEAAVLLLNIPI